MVSLLDPKQEARDKRSRLIWSSIIGAAVVALLLIGFYKANTSTTKVAEAPHYYTEHGPFINESITIEPGKDRAFKMDLNRPAVLQGTFGVPDQKTRIGCFVFTEENYQKWSKGDRDADTVISTGYIWAGKFDRRLLPGVYYIVFDNVKNPEAATEVDLDIFLN